jgi:hypothetical protein
MPRSKALAPLSGTSTQYEFAEPCVGEHDIEVSFVGPDGGEDSVEVVEFRNIALQRAHIVADRRNGFVLACKTAGTCELEPHVAHSALRSVA